MPIPAHKLILLTAVAVFTLLTVWTDVRSRKIANWATLPMWILGWAYQFVFFGWRGTLNGALGCAVGFGPFLLLWMLRIAGGGDVKLLSALGVWLGFQMTTHTVLASLAFVLAYQLMLAIGRQTATPADAIDLPDKAPSALTASTKRAAVAARVQAFAPAVAAGTWTVLLTGWQRW